VLDYELYLLLFSDMYIMLLDEYFVVLK
jgi:hypothetical protein